MSEVTASVPMRTPATFARALILSSMLTTLVYKAIVVAPVSPSGALLSVWTEAAFLSSWLVLSELLGKLFPRAQRGLAYACMAFTLITLMFVVSHAFFFSSASERRFSALELDLSMILFFFTDVLPLKGLLAMLAVLGASIAGARRLSRRTWLSRERAHTGFAVCAVAGLLTAFTLPRIPSPVVDMGYDVAEKLRTRRVRFDAHTPLPGPVETLQGSAAPRALNTRFSKVLVFVMETMTAQKLETERKALPASTFVNAAPAHGHRLTQYFPGNQDSRTGMLNMLTWRFIPYEAYTEEGRDHYMFLGKQRSLVDLMQSQGYETAFAVSQNEVELVVEDLPWKHVLSLDDAGLKKAQAEGLLCFVPYQFEHSCEDRALLPRVLELIDNTPKLFLYQEFIWGHASEYNEASGRTNTEYYSSYLDAVVDHLREKNLLDETLIVLTSDHGFRDTSLQGDPSVVRIPLMFYAPSFAPSTDGRLFAHMDFKDLLLHELDATLPAPSERPFTLVMGPTGSSFVLALTRERELMWFKTRHDDHLLLRHVALNPQDAELRSLTDDAQPASFLALFYAYRTYFEGLARQ